MLQLHRADIDGFYGEPAEFDPTLEVELVVAATDTDAFDDDDRITAPIHRLIEVAPAASMIALDSDGLEDAWFGSFDETAEQPLEQLDDMPTGAWQKIGGWLKNLGRAA